MKMQIWQMNIIISQSLQTEFCVSSTYLIMHVSKYMILVLCRAIPDKVRFLVYFAYVFWKEGSHDHVVAIYLKLMYMLLWVVEKFPINCIRRHRQSVILLLLMKCLILFMPGHDFPLSIMRVLLFISFLFRKAKRNQILSCTLCCTISKERKRMTLTSGKYMVTFKFRFFSISHVILENWNGTDGLQFLPMR